MGVDAGTILSQAESLLAEVCVHPVDEPLAKLECLRRHPPESELQLFHELLAVFAAFGDRHTQCQLPEPFASRTAFLPFLVSHFYRHQEMHLGVSVSLSDELAPGDILTAWNGQPLDRILAAHSALQLGANPEARLAKAIQTLTVRPLASMPAPSGSVFLDAITRAGRSKRVSFDWKFATFKELAQLFSGSEPPADAVTARTVSTARGLFGLMRIRSFEQRPAVFMSKVLPLLAHMPPSGLILDLRSCEEGLIQTAEQMLQLFTPQKIEPMQFEFRLTGTIRALVAAQPSFASWRGPVDRAFARGEQYSETRSITTAKDANHLSQRYRGPVVVLVDALTYSSAEMLAAGIQDHGIGAVLGVSGRTGGGGASAWSQQTIFSLSGVEKFRPLPGAPRFRIAAQRCRRVRKSAGQLLERNGVIPDTFHALTESDLLHSDAQLMEIAAGILAESANRR